MQKCTFLTCAPIRANWSQQAHDVYTTSTQRRCNVTLHQRWGDVVFTSCACWDKSFRCRMKKKNKKTLYPRLSKIRLINILNRLRECAGWSESPLGAHVQRYAFWHNGIFVFYHTSRKHTYIILTPLNPTFIKSNWGLQGYTLVFLFC